MSEEQEITKPHYGFLDSYRALLALAVAISHTTTLWFGGRVPAHLQFLQVGHQAVCGFIVLSGFSLMISVSRAGHLKGSYWNFMKRRAWRILPPYYFFVGLTLAYGLFQIVRHHSGNLTPSTATVDLLLLRDLFPYIDTGSGGILWTVCLEWKLYFFFPLFAAILMKRSLLVAIASSVVLSLAWFGIAALCQPGDWDHTAPWFAILFVLGMAVCKLAFENSSPRILASLLVCSAGFFAASNFTISVPQLALNDLGSGFLLAGFLWFVMQNKPTQKALSIRPLAFVGTYGYSIYLFHLFALRAGFSLARKINIALHLRGDAAFAEVVLISLVSVILGCYLFFLVAEKPFVRRKKAAANS